MSNKFDELTKSMAQTVSRRQALRRFGFGIGAMALACFGLANKAHAYRVCKPRDCSPPCPKGLQCAGDPYLGCYCA